MHFKHVHVIRIVLTAAKDAKTLFASATTIQMMITWMLVLVRIVKLLVNVFLIAKMTVIAKLTVCHPSKTIILNVLVRFMELIIEIFLILFHRKNAL